MSNALPQSNPHCLPVPPFNRLNYYYGQMLGARDFQTEQDYFRNKMLLQNRCLHGHGVVCGLNVEPAAPGIPEEPMQAGQSPQCPTRVEINCGLALDILGHELVVREKICVDIWKYLPDDEKKEFEDARSKRRTCSLYILLCYDELKIDKQPVEMAGNCLASNTFTYANSRESVCVRVTTRQPPLPKEEPCETCCTQYDESCVWLARIDNFERFKDVAVSDIHNEIRRPLSLYRPTVISGINWVHGADYYESSAQWLISEDHGLRIRFSRPVAKETIKPGIVDLWRTSLWNTAPGNITVLPTTLDTLPAGKQDVEELRIKVPGRHFKDLSDLDRVLIQIRCDFILDAKCGRAVDGNNIGGRVALIEEEIKDEFKNHFHQVHSAATGWSAATSGNGTPGGLFESWFRVIEQ